MDLPECPQCGSSKYSREKRPNGDTTCICCGHKDKSVEWDKKAPVMSIIRNEIEKESDRRFMEVIKNQRGTTDDKMLDMLEKSDYFKGLFSEGFTAGIYYGQAMKKAYKDVIFVTG